MTPLQTSCRYYGQDKSLLSVFTVYSSQFFTLPSSEIGYYCSVLICDVHVVPTDGKTGSSHACFGDNCISIWRYTLDKKEFSLNCRVYTLSVTGHQNKEQMVT